MAMDRWGSAYHWKKWIFRGKITYFIGFFKWSCYYMLTISKYIELEPWGWSQTIKKWSYFLVLAKFLTIFYIYEDFYQFFRIWSLHDSRIFSQINCNLLKYPKFLKFFDRTEIYDVFLAIWDRPRGYSFFPLEMACK